MSGTGADLRMQNVPLSAVVADSGQKVPHQEMLPNDPDFEPDELEQETEPKKPTTKGAANRHGRTGKPLPNAWLIILEAVVVFSLIMIPSFLVWLAFDYEAYSLTATRSAAELNIFQEFFRKSIFWAVTLVFFLIGPLIVRPIAPIILWTCQKVLRLNLKKSHQQAIRMITYVSSNLGRLLALFLTYCWAVVLLFEDDKEQALQHIIGNLNKNDRNVTLEFFLAAKIESIIAALFVQFLFLAFYKMVSASIRASFHRVAMVARIATSNRKFQVLSVLYQARQSTHATLSTARLGDPDMARDDEKLISAERADSRSVARANAVARSVFKTICPADRNYIVMGDFRPYFVFDEYEEAFNVFDVNRKSKLDLADFQGAVESIYLERFKIAKALIANNKIVKKLDRVLLVLFGLLGLLCASLIYNMSGHTWIMSMGTIVLGFGFLFHPTVGKVFEILVFVFVEHAYDVSDTVIIDGNTMDVEKVEIFNTIFQCKDGSILYSPNASLKSKNIHNRQRSRSEADVILVTADDCVLKQIVKIKSSLMGYLEETTDDFLGSVNVNVLGFLGEQRGSKRVQLKIEARYRPREGSVHADLQLRQRRANFSEKLESIVKDLGLTCVVNSADN